MIRAPTSDLNEKVNSAVVLPFSRSQDQIPHDAQHPSASPTPYPGFSPLPPPTPALLTLAPCWSPRLELFSQVSAWLARPLVPRIGSLSPLPMSPRGLPCSPSRCRGAPPPRRHPELGNPLSCGACLLLADSVCPLPPPHPRLLQNQPLEDRGLCLFGRLTPGGPEQIFVRCPHGLQRQPRTQTGAQSLEGPKEPLPVSQL
ncbi:unnamed protein product [Rangifer tarandus platyrhynchus]|uniref:Uncharacterized protein n=2 Tax=Rangifer tarandus platyrhynchus TaxID=3082113 RepID=A0ABN8XVX8_RANTA|nr:unnamed protein product [Rangifer tarandus platyrhynchus]